MLQLKNIQKNNNVIRADYYPENRDEYGFVIVDCKTGSIIESKTTLSDGEIGMYRYHAAYALGMLAKQENIPATKCIMWY